MRDASPLPPNSKGLQRTGLHCQCCGRIIVLSVQGLYSVPARGSSQRFCSAACRHTAAAKPRFSRTPRSSSKVDEDDDSTPDPSSGGARSSRHPGANSG